MELVGIQNYLIKGCIGEGQGFALLYPCCRRLYSCHIDLVQTGGVDGRCQFTEDILLLQCLDQAAIILIRHQITAGFVLTFTQDVVHILEISAQGSQQSIFIFIRCSSCLAARPCGQRCRSRSAQSILHALQLFQSCDFLAITLDVLHHFIVGLGICGRDKTIFHAMGFQKVFSVLPCNISFFPKFIDRHKNLLIV